MKLKLVYNTWVANDYCSASALAIALTQKGYPCTEAIAAQKLNQATIANASGRLYPGQLKPEVTPAMKLRTFIPTSSGRNKNSARPPSPAGEEKKDFNYDRGMLVLLGFPEWLIWVAYIYAGIGLLILGLSWLIYPKDFRNISVLVFILLSVYTVIVWPRNAYIMFRDLVIWYGKQTKPKMRRGARG